MEEQKTKIKLKTKKKVKTICPRCTGNGFITVPHKSVEELKKEDTVQCTMCESQGELEGEVYGPFDDDKDTIIIDADGVHRMQ